MPVPNVGDPAPDFALPGLVLTGDDPSVETVQTGEYTLSAARGRPLVLAFYPGDDTAVCTRQLCSYSSGLDEFAKLDAQVWAISTQDLASHEKFARKHHLRMPLLSDTDRTAVRAYGIGLGAMLRRSVFILDADGVIRWKHVALVGLTYRDPDTLTSRLAALQQS